MIESLRTTQIAFFRFATLCGFFRGSADEVQKVSVQGLVQEKLIWNHLWEHRFSGPDPRVFPPPGDHFLTPTTESPFYDWAHRQPSKNPFLDSPKGTHPQSTWRLAEAEFIIINRKNIKLSHSRFLVIERLNVTHYYAFVYFWSHLQAKFLFSSDSSQCTIIDPYIS